MTPAKERLPSAPGIRDPEASRLPGYSHSLAKQP
eukprot:CAMPEP_0170631150 /NCGR_PEP_ID=MMETSP0224-20130122/34453_1 /TAXON_ID=285029 /ORGANISM="Togula jolla, Strain CCCM 725" /LENGTH=33 /DNA_ID= /DNA_START= /DNA_END= /DNA_ORIENTATION=